MLKHQEQLDTEYAKIVVARGRKPATYGDILERICSSGPWGSLNHRDHICSLDSFCRMCPSDLTLYANGEAVELGELCKSNTQLQKSLRFQVCPKDIRPDIGHYNGITVAIVKYSAIELLDIIDSGYRTLRMALVYRANYRQHLEIKPVCHAIREGRTSNKFIKWLTRKTIVINEAVPRALPLWRNREYELDNPQESKMYAGGSNYVQDWVVRGRDFLTPDHYVWIDATWAAKIQAWKRK